MDQILYGNHIGKKRILGIWSNFGPNFLFLNRHCNVEESDKISKNKLTSTESEETVVLTLFYLCIYCVAGISTEVVCEQAGPGPNCAIIKGITYLCTRCWTHYSSKVSTVVRLCLTVRFARTIFGYMHHGSCYKEKWCVEVFWQKKNMHKNMWH